MNAQLLYLPQPAQFPTGRKGSLGTTRGIGYRMVTALHSTAVDTVQIQPANVGPYFDSHLEDFGYYSSYWWTGDLQSLVEYYNLQQLEYGGEGRGGGEGARAAKPRNRSSGVQRSGSP